MGDLPGAFIVVRRLKAGFRTYIPEKSAQEWLSTDDYFSHVDDYSSGATVSGYETATFRGTVPSSGFAVLSCFTFLHNEGSPRETEGASGFLVIVEGSYCKNVSTVLSDSEIGAVVSAIHVRTD